MEPTRRDVETEAIQCIRRLGDFRSILEANRRTDRVSWWRDWDQRVSIEAYSGCWIWSGKTDTDGHALVFGGGNSTPYVFRVLYELLINDIESGKELHHRCENKRCINPWHGEPLTHREHSLRHRGSKTHCTQGHEFTSENTGRNNRGHRYCKICNRKNANEYYLFGTRKFKFI